MRNDSGIASPKPLDHFFMPKKRNFLSFITQPGTHLRYNGSHFVPLSVVSKFVPVTLLGLLSKSVRSLQESSIVSSYSRESLQTKLSDPY